MKAIKVIPTFCACALIPLTLVAQDFSNLKYRNIGPSRGGRVTAVAGTECPGELGPVADPTAPPAERGHRRRRT